MACYVDLSDELQMMIWSWVIADDEIVVVSSKKMRGSPNYIPSLCTQGPNLAPDHKARDIIHDMLLRKACKNKLPIQVNVLDFDFTNFMRFLKYIQSINPVTEAVRGDIAALGVTPDDDGNPSASIRVEHKVTAGLERQPTKLATWIKFADNLFKKTQIRIGAYHVLRFAEESPALRDLAGMHMEFDVPMDGNQTSMVGFGVADWSKEMQWRLQYGELYWVSSTFIVARGGVVC